MLDFAYSRRRKMLAFAPAPTRGLSPSTPSKVCYDVGDLHFCPEESFINTINGRVYGLWASGIV